MSATVVVVAYRPPAALRRPVMSLEHPDLACIVANVEGDSAVAAVASASGVPTIEIPENLGYAYAVNRGIELVRDDVVVFANDDVDICASSVLELARVVSDGEA